MQTGAVSFLDVLGWKGIWKDNPDSLRKLEKMINGVKKEAAEITSLEFEGFPELRGINTDVLSISDTIAIFTPGDADKALSIHAKICKYIIPESIKNNIPVRGATSYGEYSRKGNIMIGPAIDEAASWHEATNWIGVILAPSGQFELRNEDMYNWIEYDKIPFKNRVPGLNRCVDWEMDEEEAVKQFKSMGLFVPGIAEKYLNTYEFMKSKNNR
ncbi:hypothetical protein BAMA_10565 [Bacillus manliponensis]|uniref:Uncharacterized protein n=2 Tax=Bacillus manliponensis TaxID=574376 RepID=A0A073JUT4_9BACI|nr:hypothetical protein BAMA_10565 [Bacillus manliponensis]